jgi:hypothetical protein
MFSYQSHGGELAAILIINKPAAVDTATLFHERSFMEENSNNYAIKIV